MGVALLRPVRAEAATCSFDGSTHIASVVLPVGSTELVQVKRSGTDVMVGAAACGTVTTVDTVHVDFSGNAGQLIIDLHGGLLEPGFTDEGNGTSEIEFDLENMQNANLSVSGSTGDDWITAGSRLSHIDFTFWLSLNLNAAADGATPDEDVTVHGSPSVLWIYSWEGNDHISAAGNGTLQSSAANVKMTFRDGPGADSIVGGGLDDLLGTENAADPGDTYAGGGGFDTLDYSGRYEGMRISKNGTADDGIGCPDACEGDNVGEDVERVFGGSGNDVLLGGPGSDWLWGGGSGKDIVRGNGGGDTLMGSGGIGSAQLFGGAGFDTASYANIFPADPTKGVVLSLDGVKNDGFPGSVGHDNIETDVEALEGTVAADKLTGGPNADTLIGGEGDDNLAGLGGRDTLRPGPGLDSLNGGTGLDAASFVDAPGSITADLQTLTTHGDGNDQLAGIEWLIGSRFDDHLIGSSGPNRLVGGGGADGLYGFEGNDTLLGGGGNDVLNGGPGTDTCDQGAGSGSISACEA